MRLKISFTAEQLSLPMDYRRGIQAFLYSCLNPSSGNIYHDDSGFEIKPFVFSSILGAYKIHDDRIVFDGKCSFFVASFDLNFLNEIYQSVCETGMITLYGNFVEIDEIKPVKNNVRDGTETYNTLSPITVYQTDSEGLRIYLNPDQSEFTELIKENLLHKYELFAGEDYAYPLKIYHYEVQKRMVCMYKETAYVAYRCRFQVTASSLMHELILDTGVGYRNSAGMGMVERVWRK